LEQFLDERLKGELERLMKYRETLYEQLSEYLSLRNNIQMLKDRSLKEIRTMMNLGSEFYVQTKVPDTSRIYVNVGLGIHVEYTLDEALTFLNVKERQLNRTADDVTKRIVRVKADIKLVLQALSELMQLEDSKKPPTRTFQ